ncbi:hypothetical protein Ga0100231_023880 [Opitutaceae bacterium TAV4]|nr:hypothetical protein Ga0100231_023880 [Opitutaceae bacterium TAV4]RRK00752.1 hypothetical protein Ga0100230_023455 [Opitutaceae bacterium TAV3]
MRNISFSLTTPQFRARTKDVTRRLGWGCLKAGDRIMGCEKCMGRRKGEPLVRLGVIEIVSVRAEPLDAMTLFPEYGAEECRREGFPEMTPAQFVEFFCGSHADCTPQTAVNRIEFRYVEEGKA